MIEIPELIHYKDHIKEKIIDQLITMGAKRQRENREHVHVFVLKRQKEKHNGLFVNQCNHNWSENTFAILISLSSDNERRAKASKIQSEQLFLYIFKTIYEKFILSNGI